MIKKVVDIDLIIEKTKTTIEDYKKYKQSIITEAVTKGLNPDVEMKDSGIESIKIPKYWEVTKVKHYVKIENGKAPKTEGDIPVYGSGAESFKTCGEYKIGPTYYWEEKELLYIFHIILRENIGMLILHLILFQIIKFFYDIFTF